MKNMLFRNISDRPFTGYWNGKPRTFKPGEEKILPGYLAEHFAKHLVNELLAKKKDESAHKAMSPKRREMKPKDFPTDQRYTGYEEQPKFNCLFIKACTPVHTGNSDDPDDEMDELDAEIEALNIKKPEHVGPGGKSEIITQGDDGEPDESDFDLEDDPEIKPRRKAKHKEDDEDTNE